MAQDHDGLGFVAGREIAAERRLHAEYAKQRWRHTLAADQLRVAVARGYGDADVRVRPGVLDGPRLLLPVRECRIRDDVGAVVGPAHRMNHHETVRRREG